MLEIRLSPSDVREVDELLGVLVNRHSNAEDAGFLECLPRYAHHLPLGLRTALSGFRSREAEGACRVRGLAVDDAQVGPTPPHWRDTLTSSRTAREEFFLALCATLLGDVFSWATQQAGRIVNEVVPIKGCEDTQMNSGSSAALLWHTEDAFHPYRADYIGLMCIRNPQGTATTLACVDDVETSPDVAKLLFEERFVFRPDDAHRAEPGADAGAVVPDGADGDDARTGGAQWALRRRGHARIEQMLLHPQKAAVLFGDPAAPYVRLDSDAVVRPGDDPPAAAALSAFMAAVDGRLRHVVLDPGDVLFVDNFRAVHGRAAFTARGDGGDRWMKRVNITRDLRRSRDCRSSATSRVVC